MEKLKLEVEVAKETYELGKGLDGIVGAVQKALADGWQPGQDVPQILMEAMGALVPAIQGVDKISAETSDPQAFADAVYMGLRPIPFRFVKEAEGESA